MHFSKHNYLTDTNDQFKKVRHKFEVLGGKGECFVIKVEEKWLSQFTEGGTSFRVLAESKIFVDLCNIEDYFNGTYIITCPHSSVCTSVRVYLVYYAYAAFQQDFDGNQENIELWHTVHCRKGSDNSLLHRMLHSPVFAGYPATPKCKVRPRGHISWVKDEENYNELLCVDKCVINITKYEKLFPCIDQLNIFFLGDSHMRENFFYLLYKLKALKSTMASNLTKASVGNIHYRHANMTKELSLAIEETVQEAKKYKSHSVIVFNSGMLDLIHMGLQRYLTHFDRYLNTTIAQITKTLPKNIHLVWFSTYAYPKSMSTRKVGYHINNYQIAAANTYIEMELSNQGVQIFDVTFHASNIREDRNVCGYYYICKLSRLSYIHGYVGAQIMDAFTLYMCQPPENLEL